MTALLKLPLEHRSPQPEIPADLRALLNKLRFHATFCRASAYLSIFDACAVLDPDNERAEDAQIKTLLRVLGQALEKDPVLHQPDADELSFDERWLVATLSARITDDMDSFAFLIHRRIARPKRRIFALLITGLVDILRKTY